MNRVATRAGITLLLVIALLAGLVFFICEYVAQAGQWVVFPGSPHVYNGGNIGCGVITDREGLLLLDLEGDGGYSSSESLRKATVHWLGDRYGSIDASTLSEHASDLVGFDLLNGIYSYEGEGGIAQMTLSAEVQIAALEAMGGYKGTIGIYNYKTGEILCAVTTPTYDPENVPNIEADSEGMYEGLYLNRFVQSSYVPGSIFKIVTLAAALETIPDIQEQTFVCRGTYEIGADKVTCETAHWNQDLKTAFRNSCNCAFAQVAQQLGAERLQRYVEQFGVVNSLTFDGVTTTTGNFDVINAEELNVAWGGIGQYTDQVNPCAFMTFAGAIASEGIGVQPYIVKEITSGGSKTYAAKTVRNERIMTASTAKKVAEYMAFNVADNYGSYNFPGLTVCAKTGTGEVGGDKKPNATIAGFVADDAYPLAFVIVVEEGGYGRDVCIPILSKVLETCKKVMDQ